MIIMTSITQAFKLVNRVDFVPDSIKEEADIDVPLPIGFGQTISQPTTVLMMLEWLEAKAGNKVLDVGSGSGWTTALLSHIVGPKGKVFAIERLPELVEFGRDNCKKIGISNAQFIKAGKDYGLPKYLPYDRILVSASAQKLPEALLNQLKVGGKLVIPVQNDILEISKTSNKNYKSVKHPGFVFVPLI